MKLLEYFLVFLSFKSLFPDGKKHLYTGFVVSLLFTCVLTALQFVAGKSLGGPLHYFGERPLSVAATYISKVDLGSLGILLRPYATFPHPNALAGYLLISFIFLYSGFKHKIYLVPETLVLLLTFSRTAIFLWFIFLFSKLKNIFIRLLIIFLLLLTLRSFSEGGLTSFSERLYLTQKSLAAISARPLLGLGLGNFSLFSYPPPPSPAQLVYQPVHNIYFLLVSELGIPFSIYLFYLGSKYVLKNKNPVFRLLLAVFLISGLSDHFWITSPQNLLLLSFVAAKMNFHELFTGRG